MAKKHPHDCSSLWTDVRGYLAKFKLQLDETNGAQLQLQVPHTTKLLTGKDWAKQIKLHLKLQYLAQRRSLSDQGKTSRLHGGLGSAFLTGPSSLHDASFRFAVKGRLNQVDVRSVLKRKRVLQNNRCHVPECSGTDPRARSPALPIRRRRHHESTRRDAQDRLEQALKHPRRSHQRLLTNTTVPDYTGPPLHPDIQLYDDKTMTAVIADLAVAFEDQPTDAETASNFAQVRQRKLEKYATIKRFCEFKGYTVHLDLLIYGSLGSICRGNQEVNTKHLGLQQGTAKKMEKQLSANHVNTSFRIFRRHIIARDIVIRDAHGRLQPRQSPRTRRSSSTTALLQELTRASVPQRSSPRALLKPILPRANVSPRTTANLRPTPAAFDRDPLLPSPGARTNARLSKQSRAQVPSPSSQRTTSRPQLVQQRMKTQQKKTSSHPSRTDTPSAHQRTHQPNDRESATRIEQQSPLLTPNRRASCSIGTSPQERPRGRQQWRPRVAPTREREIRMVR